MSGSGLNLRDQAIRVLVTIGDMFPSSRVAKKLDADDDATFESLVAVWMSGLAGMSDEKVARGLKTLMGSGNTFEPSVPEFVKMCRPPPAAHRPYKSLPKPDPADRPASIDHYPIRVQKELTRIGMLPKPGETFHQYAMRCKEYCMASRVAGVIGKG